MPRTVPAFLAAALLLAAPAAAQQSPELFEALGAQRQGDYARALELALPLASRGNREAQFLMGTMYEFGQGVQPDPASAMRWYQAAAAQGQPDALGALQRLEAGGGQGPGSQREAAFAAFDRGDYSMVRDVIYQLAHQGDSEAEYRLGVAFARGFELPQNEGEARRWLESAARHGHAGAQAELQYLESGGDLEAGIDAYERGDFDTARRLFESLAAQHDAEALYRLGLMHEKGEGMAADPALAAQYYREGAQMGSVPAAFALARMLEAGDGVKQDYEEALQWYQAAGARGHPEARAAVERLTAIRSGQVPQGTPVEMAEAALDSGRAAWAAELLRPAAESGDMDAQRLLGLMHVGGNGVPADAAEARRWLAAAAAQGDGTAQYELAQSYDRYMSGAEPDYAEAVRWYRVAAEQGNPDAAMALANAYREGRGVVPDDAQVEAWYAAAHEAQAAADKLLPSWCAGAADKPELQPVYAACNKGDQMTARRELVRLARQGVAGAQSWLGYLYFASREIPLDTDYNIGARWLAAAAGQGDPLAQYNLGVIYEAGAGVAKNPDEAVRWYEAAEDQGIAEAADALERLGE